MIDDKSSAEKLKCGTRMKQIQDDDPTAKAEAV